MYSVLVFDSYSNNILEEERFSNLEQARGVRDGLCVEYQDDPIIVEIADENGEIIE